MDWICAVKLERSDLTSVVMNHRLTFPFWRLPVGLRPIDENPNGRESNQQGGHHCQDGRPFVKTFFLRRNSNFRTTPATAEQAVRRESARRS
jgi:hypothetical protein